MKKILIFGATGNVGSYLHKYATEYFDKKEFEVIAVGRRQTDFFTKLGYTYYSVDISGPAAFDILPTKDVYAILFLAAQIPSYMDGYHPEEYVKSNILGAYNVLEYARRVKADRVLYTTTVFDISLYPHTETPLKPDLPLKFSYTGDHAMYVISKNTSIEFLKHYNQQYGIKGFVFRLPTIYSYSPYHYYFPKGIKTIRPVYRMIDLAMAGEPIELWGDPNYSKDMVHVYDFSQELCKAAEVDGINWGFYNIGTGIPVTLKEQISTIIDVFSPKEHKSTIVYRPDKVAGGGFLMDVENAKKELGYAPKYTCKLLFEDYKKEMVINRFADLRLK
jgi:UDP-glucose 4-epimerase